MIVLIEAVGSLTSGYLIKAIKEAGHTVVGSDISEFNHGKALCDDFIIMPKASESDLWSRITRLLQEYKIDIVIPSFDETLLDWADKVQEFSRLGIKVIISPYKTVETFQDKWKTYNFFKTIGVAVPKTSLSDDYEIIKPRFGRGGAGIYENTAGNRVSMEGMISQEKILGQEYTVDVLYDKNNKPVYIVPRKRLDVKDGKSTKGEVVENHEIDDLINRVSTNIMFIGPINFQLFETEDNKLILIEINPRIAGGMALGFAATENWIKVIIDNLVNDQDVLAKEIKYGLKMVRYYDECFI